MYTEQLQQDPAIQALGARIAANGGDFRPVLDTAIDKAVDAVGGTNITPAYSTIFKRVLHYLTDKVIELEKGRQPKTALGRLLQKLANLF